MNINKLELKSLSSNDINKIMKGFVTIVLYKDLEKYNSVNELFKDNLPIILFFEEEKQGNSSIGHWEAIKKVGNVIQFFDSYGLKYDGCRKWLSENKLIQLKENKPELTRLFNKAEKEGNFVLWNCHQYQSYKHNIATCGKWACSFLLKGDLRGNIFYKWVEDLVLQTNSKSYDEAITKYIKDKYNI